MESAEKTDVKTLLEYIEEDSRNGDMDSLSEHVDQFAGWHKDANMLQMYCHDREIDYSLSKSLIDLGENLNKAFFMAEMDPVHVKKLLDNLSILYVLNNDRDSDVYVSNSFRRMINKISVESMLHSENMGILLSRLEQVLDMVPGNILRMDAGKVVESIGIRGFDYIRGHFKDDDPDCLLLESVYEESGKKPSRLRGYLQNRLGSDKSNKMGIRKTYDIKEIYPAIKKAIEITSVKSATDDLLLLRKYCEALGREFEDIFGPVTETCHTPETLVSKVNDFALTASGYEFDDDDIVPIFDRYENMLYCVASHDIDNLGYLEQMIDIRNSYFSNSPSYQKSVEALKPGIISNYIEFWLGLLEERGKDIEKQTIDKAIIFYSMLEPFMDRLKEYGPELSKEKRSEYCTRIDDLMRMNDGIYASMAKYIDGSFIKARDSMSAIKKELA